MLAFIHHYVLLKKTGFRCFSLKTTKRFIEDNPQTELRDCPEECVRRKTCYFESRGSRHVLGYSALLVPIIPSFRRHLDIFSCAFYSESGVLLKGCLLAVNSHCTHRQLSRDNFSTTALGQLWY